MAGLFSSLSTQGEMEASNLSHVLLCYDVSAFSFLRLVIHKRVGPRTRKAQISLVSERDSVVGTGGAGGGGAGGTGR